MCPFNQLLNLTTNSIQPVHSLFVIEPGKTGDLVGCYAGEFYGTLDKYGSIQEWVTT